MGESLLAKVVVIGVAVAVVALILDDLFRGRRIVSDGSRSLLDCFRPVRSRDDAISTEEQDD